MLWLSRFRSISEGDGASSSDSGRRDCLLLCLVLIHISIASCCCSVAKSYPTLGDLMNCNMPGSFILTISQSLLKLMSIELVMPFNCFILCHPLLLPSIFPSIRVFSNELTLPIRWSKYWSFSFHITPSNEYSRLTSFSIAYSMIKGAKDTWPTNTHRFTRAVVEVFLDNCDNVFQIFLQCWRAWDWHQVFPVFGMGLNDWDQLCLDH